MKEAGNKMNMMIKFLSVTVLLITFIGCSDLQTDIPVPINKISLHTDGIADVESPNFHGKLIKNSNWDMKQCQDCHATDYSGGLAGNSCLTCHTSPSGPEACNTCHGDFTIPGQIAPPRAIEGQFTTDYRGVGAHAKHLYTNTSGKTLTCNVCHSVPASIYSDGHLDSSPHAEVVLNHLASFKTIISPLYDPNTLTCANTYCHGNFTFYRDSSLNNNYGVYLTDKMEGNNVTVTWNKVNQNQAACGTCHDLPPKGHKVFTDDPLRNCNLCHGSVVDGDGRIIDKSKHVNGLVDFN
jgi:hypothetical protein